MKLKDFLAKWNMNSLKIKPTYLEMDFKFVDADKKAAWDLYIELLTRITRQMLPEEYGDEEGVLDSIHSLFKTTRDVLKANGPDCAQFTKIAVVVLNQKIRPFTSKWHKYALKGGFRYSTENRDFRTELADLQIELKNYTKMLADMAGVEDMTEMDE
jgi:hypothetical protein